MRSVVRYVRRLFNQSAHAERTDLQLLEDFAVRREESAFAVLVERHGPLVWGVCRRALFHEQDAEDAFQAAFLILARKAASVAWHEDIAGWMHAVAVRVTHKIREQKQRRQKLERAAVAMSPPPLPDLDDVELSAVLDEEIQRLPEKYRRPILLCYLQGMTYTEAAKRLGWREGTVSGRLARARERLRQRLIRRGYAPAAIATLLSATATVSAMSASLAPHTIRASLAFAARQEIARTNTVALAEGVMRTMFKSKMLGIVVAVSCLALAGMGVGYATMMARARNDKQDHQDIPEVVTPLPKAWKGRWIVNPFADAVAFEVRHQGRGQSGVIYHIKDADAVEALKKTIQVEAVQNDVSVGLVPSSILVAHRKDGTSYEVTVLGGDQVQSRGGIIHFSPAFIAAINAQLRKQEKVADLDILQFRPDKDIAGQKRDLVKPSRKSLTSGFSEIEVTYRAGNTLHHAKITDAKALDTLQKTLTILDERPYNKEQPSSRKVRFVSKDGSIFNGHLQRVDEIFDYDAGHFTLKADFVKALNKAVSVLAGRDIDLMGENPLTEAQKKRLAEFDKRFAEVRSLRFRATPVKDSPMIEVDKGSELTPLLAGLKAKDVPTREDKVERRSPFIELKDAQGKTFEVFLVEAGPVLANQPLLCDLIEVSGLGLVWISNQWKYRLRDIISQREQEALAAKAEETTRLVCEDLPTFFKQVMSLQMHFRSGENESMLSLKAAESRPIVAALMKGKVERLDWKRDRWQQEVGQLIQRGAGTIDLAPGLGFSLPLIIENEKSVLILGHGRITFRESPLPLLQKAIDRDDPKSVEFLPKP